MFHAAEPMAAATRYAHSCDASVAYQVIGGKGDRPTDRHGEPAAVGAGRLEGALPPP